MWGARLNWFLIVQHLPGHSTIAMSNARPEITAPQQLAINISPEGSWEVRMSGPAKIEHLARDQSRPQQA